MSKQRNIEIATQVIDTAIKNSDIVAPYVKQSHYQKGLIALNLIHFGLKYLAKKQNQKPAH